VQDGLPAFETCTSSCQAGINGGGGGQFEFPFGMATDASGNLFVADTNNYRIQVFTNTGNFLMTFGWGVQDGLPALETCTTGCQAGIGGSGDGQLNSPHDVAVDASGNVFVADRGNSRIQKFTNTGTFMTKWGSSGSGDGQFDSPYNVAVNAAGDVFVVEESNNRVQKFTNTGTFLTKWGTPGSGNGQFNTPVGLFVDGSGNVFVFELSNNRIQKFACP
jgi:sugar lactone lactonase YvrE